VNHVQFSAQQRLYIDHHNHNPKTVLAQIYISSERNLRHDGHTFYSLSSYLIMEANASTTTLNPEAHEFIPDVHSYSPSVSDRDPFYSSFMLLEWPGHDLHHQTASGIFGRI
jgi:hypothetical protein